MVIVMMGMQGSGKGTQSKMLAARLGLPHISTGDIFRANIGQGTELGRKAKAYTDKGELVPDAITIDMVRARLAQDDAQQGCILDGFPRNAVQLAALEFFRPADHCVLLELDEATAIARLGQRSECPKCGILYGANRKPKEKGVCDACGGPLRIRSDDTDAEAIRTRIANYKAEIDDMVRYYDWKGCLHRIDGTQTVEAVLADVLGALGAD